MELKKLISILDHYNLGNTRNITKIMIGIINETYEVATDAGFFILQKLNPIFDAAVNYDIEAVSNFLNKRGFLTQKIIKTKKDELFVKENGGVWRLFTFIPGEVYEYIDNGIVALEAGKILGKFHSSLNNFDYVFRHKRELHHATKKHYELLITSSQHNQDKQIEEYKKMILDNLPKTFLPKNLRTNVTHGDPKISNVIFKDKKAVALIDLDDCGREHNVIIEIGDACRSWCGGVEDSPNNNFDLKKFETVVSGYFDGSQNFLTKEERKLLPQALKLITLELASRFLRDYFEDSYFGWNPQKYPTRKAHNLARTRGQLALFRDLVEKEGEIRLIINQFA